MQSWHVAKEVLADLPTLQLAMCYRAVWQRPTFKLLYVLRDNYSTTTGEAETESAQVSFVWLCCSASKHLAWNHTHQSLHS